MRVLSALLVASSLAGCIDLADDSTQGGNGKADGNGSCTVPQYGDGICQIDIACDVPDVDCYTPFETDDAAAAWLTTQMDYTRIPADDPRTVRARSVVDKAFELFKSHVQLGTLADKRLALVVLDGPENAFIAGDYMTHKGGWSVQIQSALLTDAYSDAELIGVLQHELTHLAKLHFLDEVTDRIRKFYVAPDGKEPIGEQAMQNATAQQIGAEWRKASQLAGYFTNPELGSMPYGGELGPLFYWFVTEQLASACSSQVQAFTSAYSTLSPTISPLDSSLTIDAGMATPLQNAFTALRACAAANPGITLRAYLDQQSPEWVPYITKLLAPEEIAILDKPGADAMIELVGVRRAAMVALQDKLAMQTSRPWSALRFYSYEEAADDSWVRIYTSAKLDGAGTVSSTFLKFQKEAAPKCEQLLAASTQPPYGANLADEHHADCWRIAHAKQLASSLQSTARTLDAGEPDGVDAPRIPHAPVQQPRRPGPVVVY